MKQRCWTGVAAGLLLMAAGSVVAAEKTDVLVFGDDRPLERNLQQAMAGRKLSARIGRDADPAGARLLVVPPGVRLPEEVRRKLPEFFDRGGALLALGPENLGAPAPRPGRRTELPDLDPAAGHWEFRGPRIMQSWVYAGIGGKRFAEMTSPEMRNGSLFMRTAFPAGTIRPDDRLLQFRACGDFDSELLSVSVTDSDGNQFVSYADLGREWRDYTLRFADFVPLAPQKQKDFEFGGVASTTLRDELTVGAAPLKTLDPARIVSLALGVSNRHLWWDKPGKVQIAELAVAADTAPDADRRGGYAMRYQTPYGKVGVQLDRDAVDLFDGAAAATGAVRPSEWGGKMLKLDGGTDGAGAWTVPPRPFIRGREVNDKKFTEQIRGRADRRIPVLQDAAGRSVAELILPADELNRYGAAGAVGLPESAYRTADGVGCRTAGAMAEYLLKRPQLVGVFLDLDGKPDALRLIARVRMFNPGRDAVEAKLGLTAGPLAAAPRTVKLPAGETTTVELAMPEVPEDFPFTRFDWRAELASAAGDDRIGGRIDASATLEYLIARMLRLQQTHADGRISHHYFSDIYGARTLYAVGRLTNRPELMRAGLRLLDGLISRQFAEGALPMGYGECRRIGWVADNGTAVLALVQLASWQPDRRDAYLEATRRYYQWRETFRITPERAKKLEAQFGKSRYIQVGVYGIGYNDGPFYEKGKLKETIRIERGEPWTIGISMVSLPGYYQLTGDRKVLEIAGENLRDYLPLMPAPNYFGAEALLWMYRYLPDPALAKLAGERLASGSLNAVLEDRGFVAFERGGRKTMDVLTLLNVMRHFENSPRVRAALLRHIWNHADPASPFSVYRVGDSVRHSSHGFSIAAARYAGTLSSIWLTELLYPESTMLNPAALRDLPKDR